MDHGGLGLGRRSALLAVSSRPAFGIAPDRYRFARDCVCAPCPQSRCVELSSARCVPNSQLVPLHLRYRDRVSVRVSAFVVVAIIAMVASFLYQRFLGAAEKANEDKSTLTSAP